MNYFQQVRAEMKHVSWPSNRKTVIFTLAVVAISLAIAFYLGLLDYIFSLGIQKTI